MNTFKRFLAWFELCRLPNIPTAMADPLAGALVVGAGWHDSLDILALMLASACLYAGGVALNDWCDFKKDLAKQPDRPLPAKKIPRYKALLLAFGLLAMGGVLASIPPTFSGRIGLLLISAILIYNILLRDLPAAPVVIGVCRALNLLMGMMLIPISKMSAPWSIRSYLLVAAGLYTLGLTLFAQHQTHRTTAWRLTAGSGLTWMGIILVAILGFFYPDNATHPIAMIWVTVLLAGVGYRMSQAVLTPKPQNIQLAAQTTLLGIIVLDAAMVAFTRGLLLSFLVVLLLVPAIWLDRWMQTVQEPQYPAPKPPQT